MKDIDESVGRRFPAVCNSWSRLQGRFVECDQTLEQRTQNVVIDGTAGNLGVEELNFCAVADMENFLAIARLDKRFPARARGPGKDNEADQQQMSG